MPLSLVRDVDKCAAGDTKVGNSTDCRRHSVAPGGDIDMLVVAAAVPERTDDDILGDSVVDTQEEGK